MGSDRRSRSSTPRPRTAAPRVPPAAFDQDPVWLSVAQLCLRWQLDRKTIYKFIRSEVLPAWRVGSHLYRIAMADVLRFEARNKLPPS